jgi:hypothetical protein
MTCSSERLSFLLNWATSSRISQSGGSLAKTPLGRFRTKPGFAGPGGTFSAASEAEGAQGSGGELEGRSVRELEGGLAAEGGSVAEGGSAAEGESAAESAGVGRRPIARVRARLERGGSPDRDLLGMFGGLDEAN